MAKAAAKDPKVGGESGVPPELAAAAGAPSAPAGAKLPAELAGLSKQAAPALPKELQAPSAAIKVQFDDEDFHITI